ncbi:MAG TPA: hypothetical protein VHH88_02505 [Verrucomicrobiae bacterium]|nr:hypothetical protein [Verrucomicrobiae bacterium]
MKLLFFSPDDTEVAEVKRQFIEAGIPCEVRHALRRHSVAQYDEAELWICNDRDSHRALMLCVQLGVGFAKRPRGILEHWEDLEEREEQEATVFAPTSEPEEEMQTPGGHRRGRAHHCHSRH